MIIKKESNMMFGYPFVEVDKGEIFEGSILFGDFSSYLRYRIRKKRIRKRVWQKILELLRKKKKEKIRGWKPDKVIIDEVKYMERKGEK